MDIIFTALFLILFFASLFIVLGLYLMSRMVGGVRNLHALYRLFTGRNAKSTQRGSAKKSAQDRSAHTYNNKSSASTAEQTKPNGKMFGDNEGTYVDFEEVKD